MQIARRQALSWLGVGAGGAALSGVARNTLAGPAVSYLDRYCYCSDMIVAASADTTFDILSTGDNHSRWASSIKHEVGPGVWVGTSVYTGKESIHLRFRNDAKRRIVDYFAGSLEEATKGVDAMRLANWARVIPGKSLGYGEKSAMAALYQIRHNGTDADTFYFQSRSEHASEMYRIKDLAEHGAPAPPNARPTGEYLATSSDLVAVSPETLFNFVSDGMNFGQWTWGRSLRTKEAADTFRSKSDFGGPDRFLRFDIDHDHNIVDYYVGQKPNAMRLHQSVRIFPGPAFGYDPKFALMTFTRWRAAGQSDFEWDKAVASQEIDKDITRRLLETRAKG